MRKLIEIKENDFVKYRKCIYLAKGFQKLSNGKYRLNYYFKSIKKETAKLYTNGFDDNYDWQFKYIKKVTQEEAEFLISRIRIEHPNLDMLFLKIGTDKNRLNLDLDDCIDYLKGKGYLIYKKV